MNIYTTTTARVQRRLPFPIPGMPQDGSRMQNSLGSGVLVKADGLIVTNAHVVKGADEIRVVLHDRREFDAKLVTQDDRYDLALLKIEDSAEKFPTVELRDSDSVEVGDVVLAIGNPFGVGQTVTHGIVSAVARTQVGVSDYQFFIQTDASINPGNSGGPLVDMNGKIVGINTAIFSRSGGSQGIGFAIPSNLARQVMEQIIENGTVIRGWVGIGVKDLTEELADTLRLPKVAGALITEVVTASPADQAGIKPGDVLIAVEGKPVTDYQSTLNSISALQPGKTAMLKIVRERREIEMKVSVGKRPRPKREER